MSMALSASDFFESGTFAITLPVLGFSISTYPLSVYIVFVNFDIHLTASIFLKRYLELILSYLANFDLFPDYI